MRTPNEIRDVLRERIKELDEEIQTHEKNGYPLGSSSYVWLLQAHAALTLRLKEFTDG